MSATRGLEGIVATSSSVSSIIDDVLTYQGYNIDDLAENASFEEVIFLLWNGRLPKKSELDELTKDLADNMQIPDEVLQYMKAYKTTEVHPMAALRTAVSQLGLYDDEADEMTEEANKRKAVRLQAKIPAIVTGFSRIRDGKEPVAPKDSLSFAANFLYMLNGAPKDSLSFAANFLYMLNGEEPDETSVTAFNKALVLHADHELNASTFTARVCVATLSDIYSGVTSAIGALKGPLHGGANERVMAMLSDIGDTDNVEDYIQKMFDNKEKIMGFGHRVYKNGDPRAKHLRDMSRRLTEITGESKWYDMSLKIEDIVTKEKGLLPNVDFYSASVYHSLGIDHDLFTPIFATSRVSGWLAHILEQYADNRLIRPRAEYVGPKKQEYIPVEKR
ncbi:citrate/2-methylcitrate synthase [Salibacterium qingdaonense]|uniref:Citrate synthase n=1 Tax=Salibacterium qingdaonense TaxID=266892 RepID=A0A1I4NP44_9BACI|nr:citrate/2-methylcitrate synthase [Salibacterium qingdaonense]SFM17100.1 citrate synthase [Salibacterium qingdaonense]